ncbi:group III truncated hemoglobin [Tenacibaculum aquimarinum]|uniref:group III truncated hemoglobin n=1 Tax=Tenacibaculum aquimarinum TaxID=2910675 RepID=UPI001F0A172B|nr:group III truncated hemoglobin [Tenacibaculum aquimarinum]MCH3884629.1 group III truncated hemoglobin [Tenacibaculum aquimarinum]
MKKDITSRKDIKHIISKFYEKLLNDEEMLPFFENFVQNESLEKHIDIITDFWNDILFDTITYSNNVLKKHLDVNSFIEFKEKHFTIWMSYLFETIDTDFIGLNTSKMKERATSISMVMKLKMNLYKN